MSYAECQGCGVLELAESGQDVGSPITYSQLMRHVIKAKIHTVVLSTLTPMTGPRP